MTALTRTGMSPRLPLPPAAAQFLHQVCQLGLLDVDQREAFLEERIDRLREYTSEERLGHALIQAGLLTPYQYQRISTGMTHGLILGNYVVLEEIGKGGMGVVYKAEHRLMRRKVAIKVLPLVDDCPTSLKQRFFGEMHVLAELSHPNVVLAYDAGEVPGKDHLAPLLYLVTELVEGGDLEKYVLARGLLPIQQACQFIRQAAFGLQAAHDRHLIHRDIKPSNILHANGVIKLVDFGLTRQFTSRLTDQRALLGSIEFMPPEQSHDPSAVGKEADIYSLGATIFWLLAGEGPFPYQPHVGLALRQLQAQEPRRLRSFRPDAPQELDDLLASMLDRNPMKRPVSALAVANALRPFAEEQSTVVRPGSWSDRGEFRVLLVDDELSVRMLMRTIVEPLGCQCDEARDARTALQLIQTQTYDLLLLDLGLPDMEGYEVVRQVRQRDDNPNLKIIVVSGQVEPLELSNAINRGADDYLTKPFDARQLSGKTRQALLLKTTEDRAARTADQLARLHTQLEQSVHARATDIREAHNALLFAMAKMAEQRDGETPGHLKRMQGYSRILAIEAACSPPWRGLVDERFLAQLERCVPLHDIGKIGLPDEILLKPASLTPQERAQVQEHPLIGDRMLEALAQQYGNSLDFLGMARVIVRHHHERYDGNGYPDKLRGDAIPPAARLVAVADVYDALRRMRMYKPALSHANALTQMLERSVGQFDPSLLMALRRCEKEFERIFRETED
jgi:response regulator RpfG family c-di-GMP phosphodiesterase/serine/threonine protein kinase